MVRLLGSLNRKPVQALLATIVAILLLLPLWLDSYALHILVVSFYYVTLVSSWNLLAGYTGQFSLAHHAFAALGGYTSGLLIYHFQVPIYVGIVAAPIVTLALGLFLGVLVLRMRAIYLAIATWAFAETLRILISANYTLTRGDAGLSVPPLFGTLNPSPYYYLFLGLMLGLLFLMYVVVNMPIGSFMKAIKDDELAASTMGINTVTWKLFVFSFTSCVAGTTGVFFAHYIALLSPVMMQFQEMGKIIIIAILGGLGSFIGPIIGAPLVQILFEYARDYGEWRIVVFALVVIVLMRVDRNGIISLTWRMYRAVWRRLQRPALEPTEEASQWAHPSVKGQIVMQTSADVVVIGGGIIGTAVTYYLARYGINVCLVERDDIASGTSSACAIGVALQTKPPGPKQELAQASVELYRGLAEELDADIEFANDGGMLVAETSDQLELIAHKVEKAAKAGLAVTMLSAEDARRREPCLAPHVIGASYCAEDSTVNPYLLAFAFVRAARRFGAEINVGTEVIGIERREGQISAVVTNRGKIKTDTVVNAAGTWSPTLARMVGVELPVTPRKGELFVTEPGPRLLQGIVVSGSYLMSKALPKGAEKQGMTAGLWAGQTCRGNLLVGSTREFAGFDPSSSYQGIQALLNEVTRLIPAATRRHVLRFYAGLRPASPDGLPILGRWPELPGFVLATGHEGDGIALSPITGKRIADLLAGQITEEVLAPFAPGRFMP